MKLDKFVSQLEKNIRNFDSLIEQEVDNIVARTLYMIGYRTAYDTMRARNLIIHQLHYLDRADLAQKLTTTVYEHWNTVSKRQSDGNNSTMSKDKNGNYNIVIDDWGFRNQAEYSSTKSGNPLPSTMHPRGRDRRLKSMMVDYTIDRVNKVAEPEVEAEINKMIAKIIKIIECRKV